MHCFQPIICSSLCSKIIYNQKPKMAQRMDQFITVLKSNIQYVTEIYHFHRYFLFHQCIGNTGRQICFPCSHITPE